MQKFVDGQPVGSVRQRLLEQAAQSAKVALKAAKLKPGFLVFQAGHDIAEANALAEGRERQPSLGSRCPDFVEFFWGKIGPEDELFTGHGEPPLCWRRSGLRGLLVTGLLAFGSSRKSVSTRNVYPPT